MKWHSPLVEGLFLERLHRFGAMVKVRGRSEYCAVTNTGRLRELLFPGNRVALMDHGKTLTKAGKPRKTRYSIRLARFRKKWVSIEANLAPRLLLEAWKKGLVPELKDYDILKPEVPLNAHTRFDFQAKDSRRGRIAWIEVKCVTLVDGKGRGFFPDAPSERASKHLRELMVLSRRPKVDCLVFFILQNPWGLSVSPKEDTDPLFAQTLRRVFPPVKVRAYRAAIRKTGATLEGPVPVLL